MKDFKVLEVDKFEIGTDRGIKAVCYGCDKVLNEDTSRYEVIPADGEYVLSTTVLGNPKMLRLSTRKDNKIVIYAFRTSNDTFNDYGKENRYLLGYAYSMTRAGRKVDSVCIEDLLDLAEQLSR